MADTIKTRLGQKVDSLVARSPRLKRMIAQGQQRWPKDFRIKAGKTTSISQHVITVNQKDPPLDQVLGLAHELGHLLNKQGLIPGGSSFQDFINRNVDAQIREEAAAVKADIEVRQELRKAGFKAPRLVVDTLVTGNPSPIPLDLESLVNKDAQLVKVLRGAVTERSDGNPLEVYWRDYYKGMRGIYKGLSPQSPKILLKRPLGSFLRSTSELLTSSALTGVTPTPDPRLDPLQTLIVQQRYLQKAQQRRTQEQLEALRRGHIRKLSCDQERRRNDAGHMRKLSGEHGRMPNDGARYSSSGRHNG